ncbi:hypothetical protein [Pseudomonas sp. CC6-YY-74]|uniref:hypothetical protein n=1 Tax=Pseudomonas sp. CC6-YY-74 TaxID=1930532 RepID=UPI0009A200E7|nr:hypothetical protein [Pseudomonas sp. CC6-YY-74]
MTHKEQQLTELLTLTSRSLTHLTASMTALSFDLIRSPDPAVCGAGKRMIARLEAVSKEIDHQWKLIGELTEDTQHVRHDLVEVVHLHSMT